MKVIPMTAAILTAAVVGSAGVRAQQVYIAPRNPVPTNATTTTVKPAGNAVAIAQKQEVLAKLQAERDAALAPLKTDLETWSAGEKQKIETAAAQVKAMREKFKSDRLVKRDAIAKVKTDYAARIDALRTEIVALRK